MKKLKMRIPFRSKLKGRLSQRNEIFKSLGAQQKRKEIAFDALMLIMAGNITTYSIGYWDSTLENIAHNANDSKELQREMLNIERPCSVCQRGLFMLSSIRVGNTLEGSEYNIEKGDTDVLKTIGAFTHSEFITAEKTYEGHTVSSFRYPYEKGTNERKANICCNVIKNGKFLAGDKTDYLKKWKINLGDYA